MTAPARVSRLAPLDSLRGIAAFAVPMFTHFQHFGGDRNAYPFNDLAPVHWLYVYSQFFVDLFFVLSGFVMTFRYQEPLSSRRMDGREFFLFRFSRLYPLHFVMLLACAAVEWWLMAHHEAPVIYGKDDLYHFFLHLTFLHLWFEKGLAYNYPAWSVCAEVFVYLLFFLYARKGTRALTLGGAVTIFVGIAVLTNLPLPLLNRNMARGLVGFFVGVLAFQGTEWLERLGVAARAGYACLLTLVGFGVLANLIGYASWIGDDPLPYGLVLFPLLTVASLKVPPLVRLLSLRPLTFLGDISYAVYLSHVPIQMVALAVARERKLTIPTSSAGFYGLWLATLLVVGTVVHHGLERPARRWLRERLIQRPGRLETVVAPAG
jgi:peptidoglycan/LPS O-acetylase OafA/YrhL